MLVLIYDLIYRSENMRQETIHCNWLQLDVLEWQLMLLLQYICKQNGHILILEQMFWCLTWYLIRILIVFAGLIEMQKFEHDIPGSITVGVDVRHSPKMRFIEYVLERS